MSTEVQAQDGLNALDWVVIVAAGACAVVLVLYALRLRENGKADGSPPSAE